MSGNNFNEPSKMWEANRIKKRKKGGIFPFSAGDCKYEEWETPFPRGFSLSHSQGETPFLTLLFALFSKEGARDCLKSFRRTCVSENKYKGVEESCRQNRQGEWRYFEEVGKGVAARSASCPQWRFYNGVHFVVQNSHDVARRKNGREADIRSSQRIAPTGSKKRRLFGLTAGYTIRTAHALPRPNTPKKTHAKRHVSEKKTHAKNHK